uniref:Fork-head domain-containing protein n=1 Tax=Athene cunicularia TaxID=194338 RepID=A0A663M056_ATHCN
MWVDPSLACPVPGSPGTALARFDSRVALVAGATETSSLNTSWDYPDPHCCKEDLLSPSSKAGKVQKNGTAQAAPGIICAQLSHRNTQAGSAAPQTAASHVGRGQSVHSACLMNRLRVQTVGTEAEIPSTSSFYTHCARRTLPPNNGTHPCPSFQPGLIHPCPFSPSSPQLTKNEDASRVDIPVPQEMLETHELKAIPKPWKSVLLGPQRVKLKHPRQMSIRIKGGWLRPPLNYCILITLALRNRVSGSLTTQQIYQFTRQHFPFFQVASKGWKTRIRHNLCISSCFEKTAEGHRKFREEVEALYSRKQGLRARPAKNPSLMNLTWRDTAPRPR